MKKTIFILISIILIIAFFNPLNATSATKTFANNLSNEPPPPLEKVSKVKTESDQALSRLAPDLRERAKSPTKKPVLVSILLSEKVSLNKLMSKVVYSKKFGEFSWAVGEIVDTNLIKLASTKGVLSIISTDTYKPVDVPGEEELKTTRTKLNPQKIKELIQKGGKQLLIQTLRSQKNVPNSSLSRPNQKPNTHNNIQPSTIKVREIHGSDQAQLNGFDGTGVVVAVVDTGVDFGHPDLQKTQAHLDGGEYDGWPFAYNTLSGIYYAIDPSLTIGPDTYWDLVQYTWYEHTLPIEDPTCNTITCTANLEIDFGSDAGWKWDPVTLPFIWPDTSKSHQYYYTVHPDINLLNAAYDLYLGYAYTDFAPAAVIVSDETTPGVYDTVYVDIDFNQDLTNDKPMRKGNELAGADLFDANYDPGSDGIWDLSAGMLTWIADGTNPPPGVSQLYYTDTPEAGRLISFIGDEDSHGTNCAGDIAAQGIITDPEWWGVTNALFAGGENYGGVGGAVLAGMAPGAKIAAFQNGFSLPFDSWVLATFGFDGISVTGDEAQIVSNSWGSSATINDGWDETSRFAQWLIHHYAPDTSFLVATGNGGHGYGTVTEPDGGPIIDVGASTSYGSTIDFEFVDPSQFTYGAVQPWSNRGPTTIGDISPDIVAVGAWGTGANPLNLYYGNGQAAYDLFGGTSMATPIAAGNLALLYQAYKDKNGDWPSAEVVKNIFLSSAHDLGYDVLTQGSGNVDANRATQIANGNGYWVDPAQWIAGDYHGENYAAFPSIMLAGDSSTNTFTVKNTSGSSVDININDAILEQVYEQTFNLNFSSFSPPSFTTPDWVGDITSLINSYEPDLVRAQVIFPYSVFDSDENYKYDDRWRVLFYDWKDLNSDGNLWVDSNSNGRVDSGEIDNCETSNCLSEYNRFTYGYPTGTYLEASVGRDALSRKHDGVFLGVQRRSGSDPVTLKIRLTFYRKTGWSWLTANPSTLHIAPTSKANFDATIDVPDDTRPGVYAGAIEVSDTTYTSIIPVVVHVAANSPTFNFGATSLGEPIGTQPYDNDHLFGGFDWTWRYEAGDWKLFYYDIPDGTASPGKSMIVDTQWVNPAPLPQPQGYTDVDTWIYGAASDYYSTRQPDFFGPQGVEQVGGSVDTNQGDGTFLFETATGGPREVVGGEIRDGLGFIALHNVLYSGLQFGEPIVGNAYQVESSPSPVTEIAQILNSAPFQFGGSWQETFTTTKSIVEGLSVHAFGVSKPLNWTDEPISPGSTFCDWQYSFTVSNGGLIEIVSASGDITDIDLYLYKNSNLIAQSTTSTANEYIKITLPSDGNYNLCVDDWAGMTGHFDLTLRVIQGDDLEVSNLPVGAINANIPVTFDVNYLLPENDPSVWEGLLFIGPATAPTALIVPVTIHNPYRLYYFPFVSK
jgi:subtilisin family serine protease